MEWEWAEKPARVGPRSVSSLQKVAEPGNIGLHGYAKASGVGKREEGRRGLEKLR